MPEEPSNTDEIINSPTDPIPLPNNDLNTLVSNPETITTNINESGSINSPTDPTIGVPIEPEQTITSNDPTENQNYFDNSQIVNSIPDNQPTNKISGLKRILRHKFIFIFIILIILGASGFVAWKNVWHKNSNNVVNLAVVRFKAKNVTFKILSTSPAINQINVNPATSIAINFSQPVNAQKLTGNLFITPNISGKFSQGSNPNQAIFTPNTPFPQGSKIQIMLNGSYQSNEGAKLGANYLYGFTTSLPQNDVIFQQNNYIYYQVDSASANSPQTFSFVFGSSVNPVITVTLYKSDMSHLLNSLVYTSNNNSLNSPISTASMQNIAVTNNLNKSSNYVVNQGNGIYLAVATDPNGDQLGHVWVVYSDFGVIARQDDQSTVLSTQSFTSSSPVTTIVSAYNLNGGVNLLSQTNVDGLATINTPYSPSTDILVASNGSSQALVPLSIPNSLGDIRVDQNLSIAPSVYGITDKPTYGPNSIVKYAGFVRANQDALYSLLPASTILHLYVISSGGSSVLASFDSTVNANGDFSGSFPINPSWLGTNSNATFQIYVTSPSNNWLNDVALTSFTVSTEPVSNSNITINFSKSSYLPTDQITANISATNSNGQPAANASLQLHTFTNNYYENDPYSNLSEFGNTGTEISGSPTTIQLNSQGQATYTLNVSNLPNSQTSQTVTLQANFPGATNTVAGGATTIIHQGNGVINFGSSRSVIKPSQNLISRVYLNYLNGKPMANTPINYTLYNDTGTTPTVITSGSAVTDNNGYDVITIPSSVGYTSQESLELTVSTSDQYNNKIQATSYYYVQNSSGLDDTSGATLEQLDVYGAPLNLTVGQTVTLTINSPSLINAMVTMDRGRIYNPAMIKLNPGSNTYTFTVTPNLAPSFNLTFNYFDNGVYHSEGVQYSVTNPAKQATLTLSPQNSTVPANQPTSVQVLAKDSNGNPLNTNLIVSIVSKNAYNLSSQINPSMFTSFYHYLPIMTSSASSLSSIGSGGGGRCGGGFNSTLSYTNPIGTNLLWNTSLITDNNGQAQINFTPPPGEWQINVYSMSNNSVVGSAQTDITAD